MSDTPRTNQVSIRQQYGDEWDWCRADFARQLERELNAANKRLEEIETSGVYDGRPIDTSTKAKEAKL